MTVIGVAVVLVGPDITAVRVIATLATIFLLALVSADPTGTPTITPDVNGVNDFDLGDPPIVRRTDALSVQIRIRSAALKVELRRSTSAIPEVARVSDSRSAQAGEGYPREVFSINSKR